MTSFLFSFSTASSTANPALILSRESNFASILIKVDRLQLAITAATLYYIWLTIFCNSFNTESFNDKYIKGIIGLSV